MADYSGIIIAGIVVFLCIVEMARLWSDLREKKR